MERTKEAQKTQEEIKEFLEQHPLIKKALEVFAISYQQYKKALAPRFMYYSDTTTSPKKFTSKRSGSD